MQVDLEPTHVEDTGLSVVVDLLADFPRALVPGFKHGARFVGRRDVLGVLLRVAESALQDDVGEPSFGRDERDRVKGDKN